MKKDEKTGKITLTKKEMKDALKKADGNITTASELCGVHGGTFRREWKEHFGDNPSNQIVTQKKPIWNKINLSKAQVESALDATKNLNKTCKILNISKATLIRFSKEAYDTTPSELLTRFVSKNKKDNITDVKLDNLISEVQKRGWFCTKSPQIQDYTFKPNVKQFDGKTYKVGLVSDMHLGSRYQQLTHLRDCYEYMYQQGVRDVFNAGDLCDGQHIYKDHEYELFVHGADEQVEYVVRNYPEYSDMTTHFIIGNHDASHYQRSGTDVGLAISRQRKDMKYYGFYGAYVEFGGVEKLFYLHHGAGGCAYARSYKQQKMVEQFTPSQKPFFHILGHYHVSNTLWRYRNVFSQKMPCFQGQTPYLKRKGLNPELGGLILEFKIVDKKPILPKVEFIPFYTHISKDY